MLHIFVKYDTINPLKRLLTFIKKRGQDVLKDTTLAKQTCKSMKVTNKKLRGTILICALVGIGVIFFFLIKDIKPIPQWGRGAFIVLDGIMFVSIILLIIRKVTGADRWDNID